MRDLLPDIDAWRRGGRRIALATVVQAWGSAPRPVGAKMIVSGDGEIAGSVSGGCVEGAVVEEARSVLESGRPKVVSYGVSQDVAWSVGLSCGGRIDILIEPLADDPLEDSLRGALDAERLVAMVKILAGPELGARWLIHPDGTVEGEPPSSIAIEDLLPAIHDAMHDYQSLRRGVGEGDAAVDFFVDVFPPSPRLVIVGAVHVAIPLVEMARRVGFKTFVVDPRTAFATPERFAHADALITEWPDIALRRIGLTASTYIALLSHDLKLDIPALQVALRSPARYIGALGSRKTHAKRVAALQEHGLTDVEIGRIHNPIGLDLGGRRAEEMAVAVLAEIVAVRHGIGLKMPSMGTEMPTD